MISLNSEREELIFDAPIKQKGLLRPLPIRNYFFAKLRQTSTFFGVLDIYAIKEKALLALVLTFFSLHYINQLNFLPSNLYSTGQYTVSAATVLATQVYSQRESI